MKHQIILAPAAVLFLMTLLLCFLQFTYWDMSVKRQQAKDLKSAFIAVAEADMAASRIHALIHSMAEAEAPERKALEQMANLYQHLAASIDRLHDTGLLGMPSMSLLQQSVAGLNPELGIELERFGTSLGVLRPQLKEQLNSLNQQREKLRDLHREDIDELVAETTFVTIIVLGLAILVGILLSLTFARHILRRIQVLSDSAARIINGDFSPPPAPEKIRDELDALTVSINRMTEQLIRVVAAEKLLEGAEEERRRIAMDIHDQTLADLSALHRKIERLRQATPYGDEAAAIEADLQRAMTNLRVVMDNLHPQTLDILGLPAAVESLLEKQCDAAGAPEYHLLVDDDIARHELSRLVQVTLYRIVAEAINNVLRHAHASQLEVGMTLRSGHLVLAVEDNGRGFAHAPRVPTESGGRGLHNIQERARAVGAQVAWRNSRFSSGTRFELVLPLNEH